MLRARKLLACGFAAVLACGFAAMPAMAAGNSGARELRVADTHPADYPTAQALEHMGRLIAQRSGGRLSLKVLHSRIVGEAVHDRFATGPLGGMVRRIQATE